MRPALRAAGPDPIAQSGGLDDGIRMCHNLMVEMMTKKTNARNLHVPLEAELYERLRAEAERTGRPATRIAREAIERFLAEMRRTAVREAIASYAAACAGSKDDLDPELEAAAVEFLRDGDDEAGGIREEPAAGKRRVRSR